MAQQNKTDYEGTFNSAVSGLFKNNTTGDIGADDARTLVENTSDSVPFTLDDSYTWPFPQVTASGTDTYTATLSPPITAYVAGQKFQILFTNANTGAATLNLNAVGALAITKNGATALAAGDIAAGSIKILAYDGTRLQIIGDGGGSSSATSIPFGATSGTTTLTATMSPTVTAYANGDLYTIRAGATTNGNATLNLDGVGAKNFYETPERQISISDIVQGRSYLIQYDTALNAAAGGFIVIGEVNHEELMYRDVWDASGGTFPTIGGTGYNGAIRVGDLWRISVAGTLDGVAVNDKDVIIALAGGATIAGWLVLYGHVSMALKANLTDVIGVQDLFIPASAMWGTITNGCSALTQTEMATSLFNVMSLDFDQTTQEFAQFQIVFPRKWNVGTITVVPYWTAVSGAGTVQWGISGGAYSNDDALTVAFGTAQTSTDTLIAANDLHVGPATSAITLAGTPASADFLALQISRNPASDTLTADAKLLGVSVRITTTTAKDA